MSRWSSSRPTRCDGGAGAGLRRAARRSCSIPMRMRCPARCSAGSRRKARSPRSPDPVRSAVEAAAGTRKPGLRPALAERSMRRTRCRPSVKRAVLQHDIDPRNRGTGRNGRITRADVDRAVDAGDEGLEPASGAIARPPATSARISFRTTGCGSPSPRNGSLGHPGAARHRGVRGGFLGDRIARRTRRHSRRRA